MLLSLIVWVGGLIFFPAVAQSAFSVLPTRHLAGSVVGKSLGVLHWMGVVSGMVFLASSLLYGRMRREEGLAARQVLIGIMLVLTLISQFGIIPRMDALRASVGEIDSLPSGNPERARFDALHTWSTRVESGVLLLGLIAAYLTARSIS